MIEFGFMHYIKTKFESYRYPHKRRVPVRITFGIGILGCYLVSIVNAIVISLAQFRATWLYASIFLSIIIFCICLVSQLKQRSALWAGPFWSDIFSGRVAMV